MTDFFLLFTREFALIPILILIYLSSCKAEATRLLFIVLLTMAFNSYLKSAFAIPLSESLNSDTYAFPSGHMQVAFAFWGWMMIEFRGQVLRIFSIGVLLGIAGSLVQKGYHSWFDIQGAVGFGVLTIALYYWAVKHKLKDPSRLPLIGSVITVLSAILIVMNEKSFTTHYLVLGSMVGFTVGVYLSQKTKLWGANLTYRHIFLNCIFFLSIKLTLKL